jgi:hypothetical protein
MMDQASDHAVTRRSAIKTITWWTGAAALGGLAAMGAARAQAKLAKSAVSYQDAPNGGKDCDDCLQFIAGKTEAGPASCKIVEGPISPHGYCLAFTPRPGKKAD